MKDKFQSLVGMRGSCGWLNDPLITHLSPTNHPLKHGIGKYIFSFLLVLTMSIGNVWATSYIPGDRKVVTANETIDYATIAGANATTSGKWIVNPRGGTTSGKKYTNLTSDTKGNPDGIVDNIATITSNVDMATIQVPSTAKYNQSGKYVIHMRITGITGIIAHGVTGSSGRGCAIYGQEYSTSLTENTEYGSALASMTRSGNSGSFLLQYTGFTASKEYLITIAATGGDDQLYAIELIAGAATKYSVTYKAGDGSGSDVVDSDAKTVKAFADCSFTAPSGYEFKEWQDGSSNVVAAGATVSADMTLTAIYRLIPTKYTVTYNLNGASGDAPTETDKAEGDVFNLAAAPTWAGHAFDGWLCSVDGLVKAAGASYTMTSAATTFTAQWHEVDCKIYSLTGAIGSAEVTAGTATVSADALVLGNSAARIKLTPATGETFKSGDVITISGAPGNIAKKFSAYVYAANGSTKLATLTVANAGDLPLLSGTLSGDADYVFLARIDGTTQNIYTCEVHRSCAEGTAAGLSYATDAVAKLTTDAAFTNPLTNANSLYVAGYGSSDASVATVDAAGQVTIVGAGSATITAYSATQTKAGTLYAAGTASYTLTVTAPPTYAVTYAANGGEGTMIDPNSPYLEGAEVTLLANAFTAPTSQEFDAWVVTETVSGDPVSVSAGKFTMPAVDVTVTATWRAITAKYTVHYMDEDGTTPLGADELVEVGQEPAGISATKPLFTFASWQLSGSDIALDDASWASVAANAEVTLTARWAKAYGNNVDFEAYILANTGEADDADKAEAYVIAQNYALSTKTNTTFDANNSSNNGAYAGLKIKNSGTTLSWNVVAGKVVELKAGVMVANGSLSINGGAATTIDGGSTSSGDNFKMHYFYSDAEALYEFTTSNGSAEVIKAITMRAPYEVTFNANGGDPVASQYGHPAVTLPDASNGTKSLLGWFDAAEGGNKIGDVGDSYTPAADIELFAQWEDVSTDARLSSITFSSAAGTLSPAFDPEVVNYTYTMPYPTATVPTITGATSVSAKAKTPVIDAQAANWGDVAHIHGVAESDDTKDYYITMKIAPKDGVSIIKVATTGGTNKTVTGLYAGDGDVNLSSSTKMDGGKYIGFSLDGTTLQAGDRINVHTTTASTSGGSHIIFYDNMTDKNELYDTEEIGGLGDNIFTINAAMVGKATAYVYRSDADAVHKWNGYIDYIEVTRAMNPVLTAIAINGEAGTINESAKTVAVELQPGYDLAALTIVPTIVSNTAEADVVKTVESNSGNWVIGDNTYRLTDKDGDYTEYTVTLSEGEVKHTVSFNTHGGSAVESVEVVDGQKLAAAPADPTKDDYIFQGWAETADGAIVDVTTFAITADKEFHAVWASDGAIKLLDGSTVNHTNFITGVTADETVEFQGNTVNYAKFSGTVSGVNGVKDLTRVIAYNATTNKTKIRISAHNNSTSARSILVKGLVEGASAAVDLATIALGNKEDKVSDWIEFDNAANRTIYIMVSSSAGDVYFTQVKVIESGETPMKQAGEAGYSLNLNKGRFFGPASTDLAFEGLDARLSGDYTALNSGYAKLNSTSMSFTVASAMTLSLTTANNKTYYVTEGAAGTDNETAKTGVSEFDLTAGTWYITAGSSEVQFTNIAFTAPKCEEPTITPMSNSDLCEGDDFAALTVSASVSDGGDLHYQWYKEAGADDEAVGTDAASYTPEADGQYYVVVTNQLDGYSNNSATSNTITVAHFAAAVITTAPLNQRGEVGDVVTLSVVATGKNVSYKWYTCDEDGGNEVALDPAETGTSLNVTITAGLAQWYKVIVTSDCGNAEAKAKVSEFQPTTPANVTNSILWDWTSDVWPASGTAAFTNEDAPDYELLADADAIVPNAEGFRSDMLYGKGQYVWRYNNKFFQGTAIKFISTVAGKVRVNFRSTGSGKTVNVAINGTAAGSRTNSFGWSEYVVVEAGEVEILCSGDGYTRIQQIEFLALAHQRTSGYNAGDLGTVCLEDATIIDGANLYELAGLDQYGYLAFDQITTGELEAGKPYLFEVTNPSKVSFYKPLGAAHSDDEIATNGMIGTFTGTTLTQGANNYYYFSGRHIWRVNDFTVSIPVPAYRCYVDMDVLRPVAAPLPMPGRKRVAIGVNGAPQVTTGIDNAEAISAPRKMMINGKLFILRGEKTFDATGRFVK